RRRRRGRPGGGHGDAGGGRGDSGLLHGPLPGTAAAGGGGPAAGPKRMTAGPPDPGRHVLRTAAAELVAASAIVLFQELALIRWLPGQVRVLAYYPNLVLFSAFLGLGLGCLRAGRRSLLP